MSVRRGIASTIRGAKTGVLYKGHPRMQNGAAAPSNKRGVARHESPLASLYCSSAALPSGPRGEIAFERRAMNLPHYPITWVIAYVAVAWAIRVAMVLVV